MNQISLTRDRVYERFFDRASVGFSLLDKDLRYIRVNAALARINGVAIEGHIGRLQQEVVPQIDEIIARAQRRVIETGEPSTGHKVRVETKSNPGVTREFEVDYFPVPAEDGSNNLGCCVHESHDSAVLIDALRTQSERSRDFANNLNFFLASLASDGSLLTVNAPALQIAGLQLSDVQNRFFWECPWFSHDSKVQDTVRARVENAIRGEPQRFELSVRAIGDERIDVDIQLAPLIRPNGELGEIVASGVDISDRRASDRNREIRHAELQHRVNNIFSNVLALTHKIAAQSTDLKDFMGNFDQRIIALARANDMLAKTEWSDMPIRDLIDMELAPYRDEKTDPVSVSGDDCKVTARDAPMVGLAIHELATNAAKYGALSKPEGKVVIKLEANAQGMLSAFEWCERGGPPVEEGTRTGFGSILLEKIVPGTMGLAANFDRSEQGLCYRLD